MTKDKLEVYFEKTLLKTVHQSFNLLHFHKVMYYVLGDKWLPAKPRGSGWIDNLEVLTDLNDKQKKCVLKNKVFEKCKNKGLK